MLNKSKAHLTLNMLVAISLILSLLTITYIPLTITEAAGSIVLNFDDITGYYGYLPVGYAGLNWDPNWLWWGETNYPYTPSSPPTVIYTWNYGGWIDFSPLGKPVIFGGAYFAGDVYSNPTVYFEGYRNGTLIGTSNTISPNDTPTFLAANFTKPVDYVRVVSSTSNYWVMDDLTYSFEPTPVKGGVGGEIERIDKSGLILPWLALGAIMLPAIIGMTLVYRRSKR
jgi:hypothetical protein